MPSESVLAGVQIVGVVLNFGLLALGWRIALSIADLRTEFLKLQAEHVRDYHGQREARATR